MSFSVHTFEVNPDGNSKGFSFHENVGEGQDLYFLARFHEETPDAQSIAESIFGEIVDTFSRIEGGDAYENFEEALKNANAEAKKNRSKFSKTPDIVVAYFDFHNLYLTQCGQSEAYLLRTDTVSQIIEPESAEDDLFSNILSGQVTLHDTVMLASSRILRTMTASQLSEIFQRSDFDEACGIFRHELTGSAEEDILASVIGVGKQSKAGAAGFLSKMVSKIKPSETAHKQSSEPIAVKTPEPESIEIEMIADDTPIPDDAIDLEAMAKEVELQEKDLFGGMPEPKEPQKKTSSPTRSIAVGKNALQKGLTALQSLNYRQKKRGLIAVLGLLLVILIGRSVSNFESETTKEMRNELQIAREALQQADTFLLQGDRDQAAELLDNSQAAAQKVLNAKSKDFRFDAQTLLADIQEKQLAVENAKRVDPQLLADLGVKNDNISALGLLELKNSLYGYDTKSFYKTIRNIVETGVQVSGKETILTAATREDQNTLVFLTDAPRIIESKNGVITPMSTTDENWKKGSDIKTFGRFSYVLDPVENQIWKYERRRTNYSNATAYNQGADLSRGVSMAIDGSIYVLADDGSIIKFFRGVKADFEFRELPSIPFEGKKLRLYTTPGLDFIYVLDPENTRILIFTKGDRFATYRKQVIFEKISDARDFVIDETGQKANIITADKIYELSL